MKKIFGIAALVFYFGFAAAVLALRFWILPQIEDHPEAVAEVISRNIGQRISIGSADTGWQRLRPYLALTDVRLYDPEGRVALSLPSVSCTVKPVRPRCGRRPFQCASMPAMATGRLRAPVSGLPLPKELLKPIRAA